MCMHNLCCVSYGIGFITESTCYQAEGEGTNIGNRDTNSILKLDLQSQAVHVVFVD